MVMILTALQQLLSECLTAPLASKEEMEAVTLKRPSVLSRLKKRTLTPDVVPPTPRPVRQPTEGIRQSDLLEAMKQPHTPARTSELLHLRPTQQHDLAEVKRLYKYNQELPALLMIGNAIYSGIDDCGAIPCNARVSEERFAEFDENSGPTFGEFYHHAVAFREYFVIKPATGFTYAVKVWPDPALSNQSVFCDWKENVAWAM
jgi:hypothetical protein